MPSGVSVDVNYSIWFEEGEIIPCFLHTNWTNQFITDMEFDVAHNTRNDTMYIDLLPLPHFICSLW